MKIKQITITINIPDQYKYLAVQPWGTVMAFIEKPVLNHDDGFGGQLEAPFWSLQKDELEITSENLLAKGEFEGYRDSVREI